MKRLLVLVFAVCILVTSSIAFGEEVDFKKYTDSELLLMIADIQSELLSRQCFNENIYLDSKLVVGVDLEAGFYTITKIGNNPLDEDHGEVTVYETTEDRTFLMNQPFRDIGKTWTVELKNGNYLKTYQGIFSIVKVG